jgi:hypothetical protein
MNGGIAPVYRTNLVMEGSRSAKAYPLARRNRIRHTGAARRLRREVDGPNLLPDSATKSFLRTERSQTCVRRIEQPRIRNAKATGPLTLVVVGS